MSNLLAFRLCQLGVLVVVTDSAERRLDHVGRAIPEGTPDTVPPSSSPTFRMYVEVNCCIILLKKPDEFGNGIDGEASSCVRSGEMVTQVATSAAAPAASSVCQIEDSDVFKGKYGVA